MTVKTGGYPTLQKIYVDYLRKNCGENNQYTYNKMISYIEDMGDYWPKIIEQMLPATTLWTGGMKVQNSVFHRDKFVYRCFSMSGTVSESATTTQISTALSGWTSVPTPLWQASMMPVPFPPPVPAQGGYYNNILSGDTPNPLSTYANGYNIDDRRNYFGTDMLDIETRKLANKFHSNENIYSLKKLFTKQGSTNNLLCVYGLKQLGKNDTRWLDGYNLGGGTPTPTQPNSITPRGGINTQTSTGGRATATPMGGGGY